MQQCPKHAILFEDWNIKYNDFSRTIIIIIIIIIIITIIIIKTK